MSPIYPHEEMPLDDLCAALHKCGSVWFKNADLLLLEELIRRARRNAGAPTGDHNGRHQPVRDVPAPTGTELRRPGSDSAGSRDPERSYTEEEIAQIEAHARGAFAALTGGSLAGESG